MKSVLIIAPPFFGYYQDVMAEFELLDWHVDYANDRPSDTVFYKSVSRLSPTLVTRAINRYFNQLRERITEKKYDLILFLGGMSIHFNQYQMKMLRASCMGLMIIYLWDSLKNCRCISESLEYFDVVFSFDREDCDNYGLNFLPLFYSRLISDVGNRQVEEYDYDACFIGSVHQISKFENILKVVDDLECYGARVFSYYFMPSKSSAVLRRFQNSAYRRANLRFTSLSRSVTADIYAKSKTIIDSPQANQRGLTIRTIEAVGANRKVLTCNPAVTQYDFFQSGNVYVYERDGFEAAEFVKGLPKPYDADIRFSYSSSQWLARILSVVM